MSLRLATFNIENLMTRFDFSGFRNGQKQDRVLKLFDVESEGVYRQLEQARVIAATLNAFEGKPAVLTGADARAYRHPPTAASAVPTAANSRMMMYRRERDTTAVPSWLMADG